VRKADLHPVLPVVLDELRARVRAAGSVNALAERLDDVSKPTLYKVLRGEPVSFRIRMRLTRAMADPKAGVA